MNQTSWKSESGRENGARLGVAERVIEPQRGWANLNLAEVWRSRALLFFLMWRDIKVRYKQTALGATWAVLQPLATMAVFSLFFGRFVGLNARTHGTPYPLYVYAGLLPWTFFATSVGRSGNSLIGNANLVNKIYLPRLSFPLAAVGSGLLDVAISCLFLFGQVIYYGIPLSWKLVLAPVLLFGTALAALGVGTLLSALTVTHRDFVYVVPLMLQLWMYATPIIYPASVIPRHWQWLQWANPLAGLIEGFRAAFTAAPLNLRQIGVSLAISLILCLIGTVYFRNVERRFADVI